MIADLKPYAEYKESGLPWLGQVPGHWDSRRLRHACDMRVSNVDKHTKLGETPVRLCNYVEVYKNERIRESTRFMAATTSEDERVRFGLRKGDVLITKDSEQWNDIGVPALVEFEAPDLVCGYHLAILRARRGLHGAFLHRALESHFIAAQFHVEANGVTRYGLSHGAIQGVAIPFPPPDEQAAIVRFLDWANERLERAIRAKRKVIALLNEQKQAIIHRAVTRGLDPSVPLKPSGIPWLGDIPQHWEVHQLRRLVRPGRRITYGIVQPGEPDPNGRFMIRGQDYSTGWARAEAIFRVSPAIETPYSRSRLAAGDLVVTIVGAGVGNIAIVPGWLDGANITQTTARVSIDPSKANPAYVALVLQGPIGKRNVERYVKGAAQPGLNLEHVRIFLLPSPPLAEQLRIVESTKSELDSFDRASSRLEREIELLREYRTRLVADVVTGKLDVREAAARLPDEGPLDAVEDDAELGDETETSDEEAAV